MVEFGTARTALTLVTGGADDRPTEAGTDRELWRRVAAGEAALASAPPVPPAEPLAAARAAATATAHSERRLAAHVDAATETLAHPLSWLQPVRRAALARQLRTDLGHLAILRARSGKAEAIRDRLEEALSRHRAHLSDHRATLDAAKAARAELGDRIDKIINWYAEQDSPPAWFAFGVGYPPDPASYQGWLRRARAVLGYRLRFRIEHALEPLGTEPGEHTRQHPHWLAARALM